jgi:hypothetical protein
MKVRHGMVDCTHEQRIPCSWASRLSTGRDEKARRHASYWAVRWRQTTGVIHVDHCLEGTWMRERERERGRERSSTMI